MGKDDERPPCKLSAILSKLSHLTNAPTERQDMEEAQTLGSNGKRGTRRQQENNAELCTVPSYYLITYGQAVCSNSVQ